MSKSTRLTVAQLITAVIKGTGKSQVEIAKACGWPKPNFVTMLKKGDSKLPLDKVGPLAEALGVDPVYLFWLVLSEYMPETLKAIESSIRGVMLSDHERAIILAYRGIAQGLVEDVVLQVAGREVKVKKRGIYRGMTPAGSRVSLTAAT